MKQKIADTIAQLPSGSRIRLHLNPARHWECALVFRALDLGLEPQWIFGTLHKFGAHTSFFALSGECSRLPITRVNRRRNRTPMCKTAVYDYILDIEGAP